MYVLICVCVSECVRLRQSRQAAADNTTECQLGTEVTLVSIPLSLLFSFSSLFILLLSSAADYKYNHIGLMYFNWSFN